jgi:hypothetical protein
LIKLTIFGENQRSWSLSLCSFLHSPVSLSIVVPNIFLSTLLLNTLGLCSFLNVREQVSHPYKTKGKIIVHRNNSNFSAALFLHVMPDNLLEVYWSFRGFEYGGSRFLQQFDYAPTKLLLHLKKEAASPIETSVTTQMLMVPWSSRSVLIIYHISHKRAVQLVLKAQENIYVIVHSKTNFYWVITIKR